MDIRGIEITNQLRSAIRAKLLELGVRYDDELPDYILVMVVNKKSRQQMNEDLHLFLEDNTEPFVNWLHDQVLKKLQKVTYKKKSNKEIVPSAVIKEEKEKKKIKIEDQSNTILHTEIITKVDRDREFEELVGDLSLLNQNDNKAKLKDLINEEKSQKIKNSVHSDNFEIINNIEKRDIIGSSILIPKPLNNEKKITSLKHSQIDVIPKSMNESASQSLQHTLIINDISIEKNTHPAKRLKISEDFDSKDDNKLKSCISKPKITSVVSVKTRLGIIPHTKKVDVETKISSDIRSTSNKSHLFTGRNEIISQGNNFNQFKSIEKRKQRNEDLINEQNKNNKIQFNTNIKNDELNIIEEIKHKEKIISKIGTIKSRLGTSTIHKPDEPPLKSCNSIKVSKPRVSNVKSRLGVRRRQKISELSDTVFRPQCAQNSSFVEEDDDAVINTSLKSHIIAVKKHEIQKQKQKIFEPLKKQNNFSMHTNIEEENNKTEDNEDPCKISSKVIVTPRPLKPLQPSFKRATQSLLLRAVAEANQSVVMQKKMDPCLKEQKHVHKIKVMRDPWKGKILSVDLNSKKRLVMEKIQIELTNPDMINLSKPHSSQVVTDEHLNMVKSLFKRSDDKQKFLVTLNGYNNNILKERNSDDEEIEEVEVNEGDEFDIDNKYRSHDESEQVIDKHADINNTLYINEDHGINDDNETNKDTEIEYIKQNIETNGNDNSEDLRHTEISSKRKRKLSPIIYTRSRSSTPENKPALASTVNSVLRIDKRPLISSVITTVADKSNEKCRYWPNCTLGIKCAYYHPEVLCSSFPACKFGEKCAYKHPKCKFGSSCTKLACMFTHPPIQCKYHPYCMKPGCPFSHLKTSSSASLTSLTSLTPDISNVRAKFTWKKKE